MRNNYDGLVEPWKVDLIEERARRRGMKQLADINDAEQEIILAVMAFKFDKAKSNGASEMTAMTALIDRKLLFMRRSAARQKLREEKYLQTQPGQIEGAPGPLDVDFERTMQSTCDVQMALKHLDQIEKEVCQELSNGKSLLQIARGLGVTRYKVERIVEGIRQRFESFGLGAWVGAS